MGSKVSSGYRFFIVVNSVFLFILQPLIAKSLLPQYGGTASVIAGCMVFFQGVLLFGYGYGSFVFTWRSLKIGLGVYSALVAVSVLCLAFVEKSSWQSPYPWMNLLGNLAPWFLPYWVLSSGSVVLSQCYALQVPNKDAYRLYDHEHYRLLSFLHRFLDSKNSLKAIVSASSNSWFLDWFSLKYSIAGRLGQNSKAQIVTPMLFG